MAINHKPQCLVEYVPRPLLSQQYCGSGETVVVQISSCAYHWLLFYLVVNIVFVIIVVFHPVCAISCICLYYCKLICISPYNL